MPYEVVFPSERVERAFQKSLEQISADYREAIVTAIRSLATNLKPQGKRTKKLTGQLIVLQFTAQYRLRIGPYRILYDVDDQRKKVVILKLAKRDERTYK
ncbi:MAG: type II toxin-antitoxin system RelE/ParE family toxin [Nitrospira sp. LK70]|nr:type II toxin-antitoxin system RelE/ParE family toxin [Nitrospira sp. LK70]